MYRASGKMLHASKTKLHITSPPTADHAPLSRSVVCFSCHRLARNQHIIQDASLQISGSISVHSITAFTHGSIFSTTSPSFRLNARPSTILGASQTPEMPVLSDDEREAAIAAAQRCADMLNDIVEEVVKELFVEEGTSYVMESAPELDEAAAIRCAVVSRVEHMDALFLGTLDAFIEGYRSSNETYLADLLTKIRTEILSQVSLRLPPVIQVLNHALQHSTTEGRLEVIRTSLTGGKGDIPGCDIPMLCNAANQFVTDMEEQVNVIDRRLLARLCLLREELSDLQYEVEFNLNQHIPSDGSTPSSPSSSSQNGGGVNGSLGAASNGSQELTLLSTQASSSAMGNGNGGGNGLMSGGGNGTSSSSIAFTGDAGQAPVHAGNHKRSTVPQRCAAFLKELVVVKDQVKRVGLLEKAFREDWEGAAPKKSSTKAGSGGDKGKEQPDFVRPGRFMATLTTTRQSLMETQPGNPAVVQQLENIRREALTVLDRMQQ